MNKLHMTRNPWAASQTTIQCQHCGSVFPAQRINCIDTLVWPEGRQILDEDAFFHPVCPSARHEPRFLIPAAILTGNPASLPCWCLVSRARIPANCSHT